MQHWQYLITGERHELPHAVAWLGQSSDLHASSMRRGSPTREFAALGYFTEYGTLGVSKLRW